MRKEAYSEAITVSGLLLSAAAQTADCRREEYDAMCAQFRAYNEMQTAAGLPEFDVPSYAEWSAPQQPSAVPAARSNTAPSASAAPLSTSHGLTIQPGTGGTVELRMHWPSNFTDRLELFASTNLTPREWRIVENNILTEGKTGHVWNDTHLDSSTRFYAAGNAGLDSDADGIPDLRERLLYGTDPYRFDTDQDRLGDGDEIDGGTDPKNYSNYWIEGSGTVDRTMPPSPLPVTIEPYDEPLHISIFHFLFDYTAWPHIRIRGVEKLATVAVDSGNSFQIDRIVINRTEGIQLSLLVRNRGLIYSSSQWPGISGRFGGGVIEVDITCTDFVDPDGIPRVWKAHHRLSLSSSRIGLSDPDGDGLANLYEYWSNGDPNTADAPTNTVLTDAIAAVHERIVGRTPANAFPIFSVQDHANARYVRNTNCWASDIDLTCISPWNSHEANKRAGTLISPRHVLFAGHYSVAVGRSIRFIGRKNQVVERSIVGLVKHPEYRLGKAYGDLAVGLLDADVPTNRITFTKVLPDDYRNYIGSGLLLPVLHPDQEEKAIISSVKSSINADGLVKLTFPGNQLWDVYWEIIQDGDSGNPAFLILDGQLVLLQVNSIRPFIPADTGISSSVVAFKDDLNRMMAKLDATYGITNGCQLTELDLSPFHRFGEETQENTP